MSYPPSYGVHMTPSEIGAAAEREVACALSRAGWSVFVPLFDSHGRIDLLAIDPTGRLLRMQVKTARLVRDGSVLCFRTCSNTRNRPSDYHAEVDVFGIWSPDLAQAFVVPESEAPSRLCHLRLRPTANGQAAGVRFAEQYRVLPAAGKVSCVVASASW